MRSIHMRNIVIVLRLRVSILSIASYDDACTQRKRLAFPLGNVEGDYISSLDI